MLLELIIDYFREQCTRLLRGVAILSAASLVLGLLEALVQNKLSITSLTAWIDERSAEMFLSPDDHHALILAVFVLPAVLAALGIWECLRLFFTAGSRKTLGYLLAYPLPRWKVFVSRVTFLAATGLFYVAALAAGFSIAQALVTPQVTIWMIWAYLPGAFLLYIFYSLLTAAFVFITSRVWSGLCLSGGVFLAMYLLFLSPTLAPVNWRGFSLLTAYVQSGWGIAQPGTIGLLLILGLNILVGAGLWWLFDRADLD